MSARKAWRPGSGWRGARFLLALAAAALGAGAALAQNAPAVIAPLQVEPDRNNVNLHNGRTRNEMPVLSVPGAPNLRFDRVQNAAPYINGLISSTTQEEHDRRSYAVHIGAASADAFDCFDAECFSATGTGSTIAWSPPVYHLPGSSTTYTQGGSGAVWLFNRLAVSTPSPDRHVTFYASQVSYPSGETIAYSYDTASPGLPFGQILYRPTRLTSNLGYYIEIKYHGTDPYAAEWGMVREAAIYSTASAVPLGRLSYSGATITDHGARAYADPAGRAYVCQGCVNAMGADVEANAGSFQLPGEGSPALQVAAHPGGSVVGSVTRDGVAFTYSYVKLRQQQGTVRYIFDRLTVNGPDGFHQVYDVANIYRILPDIPANRVHTLITRATDSLNRATSFYYDYYDRPVRIVHPELNEVSVLYDYNGNIISRTATPKPGSGSLVTEEAGFPVPTTCAGVLCWRPTWSRDGRGFQTDYAYNASGQPTEQVDPADANGVRRRTSIIYESATGASRRKWVRICADTGTTCGTGAAIQTEYQYTGPSLLPTLERRRDGATGPVLDTTHAYDVAGRLLSTDGPLAGNADSVHYRYDVYGRRTWEIGAAAPNGARIATRTAYRDSDDRPLYAETGTIPNATSEALSVFRRADFGYDPRRNPIRETVSAASGTTYTLIQRSFDNSNRITCEARRMNPAAFATLGADACILGTQGSYGPDRITRTTFDAAGQRLQLREGVGTADEGSEATWAYDLNGRVTTIIDGNGNRAQLRYDGHGRQSCWAFPSPTRPPSYNDATPATAMATAGSVNGDCVNLSGDIEAYGYDEVGNRTSLRKRDGRTILYAYDGLNRVISKTYPQGGASPVYYSYDLRGLQLSARYNSQSGEGVTNAYDAFGRLASHSINMGGVARTLTYQYDNAGNRIRITHPDGTYFWTDYDALSRPWRIRESDNDPLATIAYDAAGLPSSLGFLGGTSAAFAYDAVSRLSSLTHNLDGTSHDSAWTYTRNPASQIASLARTNDAYAWTGHYAVARAYTTDGLNRYSAAGSASFGYDANGNLTSDGTRTYSYDIENRLVGASGGLALAYDPLGRLWQTSGGPSGTTRYLYDGDALIAEYNGSNTLVQRYVHGVGADVPLVWYEASARRYLHADHQGSIVAIGQAYAAPYAINRYDEYGIPGAGNAGRFQYTGQIWLPDLGMYHYKARIYSPYLGRFLQTDPIGYDDQFNLYAYVGNDPVNRTDPTGTYICAGNRDQCAAAEKAINDVRVASRDPTLSRQERNVLSQAASFYGRAGHNNGAAVIFATPRQIQEATRSQSAAATVVQGPRTGTIAVVLPRNFGRLYNDLRRSPSATGRDLSRFSERAERAGMVAHEGKHGYDKREGRPMREGPAYEAGRAVARSMGAIPFSELPEDDQ